MKKPNRTILTATLSIAIASLAGCGRGHDTTPESPARMTTDPRAASWHAACASAFNEGRLDAVSRCYTADAKRDREGFAATPPRDLREAFPDASLAPRLVLANGREAASIVLLRGTQRGSLALGPAKIAPTGRRIGLPMLQRVTLDDQGAARAESLMADTPLALAQLGQSPAPARPPADETFVESRVVVARGDAVERANAAAHVRAYELFGRKDRGMFDLFADDVVEKNPSEPEDIKGKKNLVAFNEAFWAGFPDVHVDVARSWGAGEYSFLEGRLVGTNTGDMPQMGISKTGKKIDVPFLEVVRWKDGKAAVAYPFMDSLVLASQLGLGG